MGADPGTGTRPRRGQASAAAIPIICAALPLMPCAAALRRRPSVLPSNLAARSGRAILQRFHYGIVKGRPEPLRRSRSRARRLPALLQTGMDCNIQYVSRDPGRRSWAPIPRPSSGRSWPGRRRSCVAILAADPAPAAGEAGGWAARSMRYARVSGFVFFQFLPGAIRLGAWSYALPALCQPARLLFLICI